MSQDIAVGDELVGDDGEKRTVLDTTIGQDMMYEVKQKNGMTYVVNSKHTLLLKYTIEREIRWIEHKQWWIVNWFNRDTLVITSRSFPVKSDITKEQAFIHATDFTNSLQFTEEIEITVDKYMTLKYIAY